MARQTKVTVRGVEYTLQSVSPTWLSKSMDEYGVTGDSRQRTTEFYDNLIKNVVVAPPDVAAKGIKHFDENDDIGGYNDLRRAIDTFLNE